MRPVPITQIAYKNVSGEVIPPFAAMKLSGDCETVVVGGATRVFVKVTKPDGTGPYLIDSGKGAAASGSGAYGQGYIPLSGTTWAKYNGPYAPATAWKTEIGPVSSQWYMDATGTGYLYAGAVDLTNGLALVSQKTGTGGGSQIIQFQITSVNCPVAAAIGLVTVVMCDGASAAVGDSVDLVDPLGYLVGNPELLINHTGFAVSMHTTDPYTGSSCTYSIISMDDLGYNC